MIRVLHWLWQKATLSSFNAMLKAAQEPERIWKHKQQRLWENIKNTAYGRRFSGWEQLPVAGWAELAPFVERVIAGDDQVLTQENPVFFERTSGSSGTDKLIPYTPALRAEFSAATSAWLHDLYRAKAPLQQTRAYWSISPAARPPACTPTGVPIGLVDDTEYLSPLERFAARRLMAVSGSLARVQGIAEWRRATLNQLLIAEDLGFISIWSPTFLARLLEPLAIDLPFLNPEARKRAETALASPNLLKSLWPRLGLISCWTEGAAASQLGFVERYGIEIQPKGLLATEGVTTIPLYSDPSGKIRSESRNVIAITAHVHEFLEEDRILKPWELEEGGSYRVLLSTGAGFLRYDLGDRVQVSGWWGRLPILRFLGRSQTSDLVGEKLGIIEVETVLKTLPAPFALLVPCSPPGYRLFIEHPEAEKLAFQVEHALLRHYHYRYARELGQLGPVQGFSIERGWEHYVAFRLGQGARLGDIKPLWFDPRLLDWKQVFEVEAV
jgi:hypothetical protein